MITELKRAFKLLKYGYQLKTNLISGVLLILFGIISQCIFAAGLKNDFTPTLYVLGAFYFILGLMIPLQIQLQLLYCKLAMSSPRARFLEITFGDFLSALVSFAGYTLIVLCALLNHFLTGSDAHSPWLLAVGLLIGLLQIYLSIVYKSFVFGTLLLLISVFLVFGGLDLALNSFRFPLTEMSTCTLWGYAALLITLAISALLRRLLRKYSFSKLSYGSRLRKEL